MDPTDCCVCHEPCPEGDCLAFADGHAHAACVLRLTLDVRAARQVKAVREWEAKARAHATYRASRFGFGGLR